MKPVLNKYEVTIIATTVSMAKVIVEAISSEDAHEIAVTGCKPEDFEVTQLLGIDTTESNKL
jgi:hypothetical protein